MFGNGYTPQESKPLLPEGEYKAQIRGAEYGQLENGRGYVDVYFNIKDEAGNRYDGFRPDSKRYFDRPMYPQDVPPQALQRGKTLADMQLSWDRAITAFFDAFAIPRGEWNTENWRNKIGYITVRKSQNSAYMDIFPDADKRRREAPASIPQPAPQPQQAMGGYQDMSPNFDDIPF